MAGKRGGGWLRVSSGAQDEQLQRLSILRQAKDDGVGIVKWYTLHGDSAYKGEQAADLADVLADAGNGVITDFYFYNSDRLERRGIQQIMVLRHEFRERGAVMVSVTEPYWRGYSPDNERQISDAAERARIESKIKQDRQNLLVIPAIRANGAFFGKCPFGYEVTGEKFHKRLVPTATGRKHVPQIYDRIIRGDSLSVVCYWLDSLGIRFRKDGSPAPWWPATVMQLIRNPVYIGHHATDEGLWVHACASLVDATTFRLANEALSDRCRKQRGPRGKPENRAMLKGAIRCPACDVPMVRNQGSRNKKIYYRCRGTGPAQKGCGNFAGMDAVDAAVDAIIAGTFRRPVMLRTRIPGTDHQLELDELDAELRQLPARGLSRADEQAERERLWAEQDRVAALPDEEDRWEETPTGELYSDLYAAVPVPERGAWLKRHGFTVYATKAEVTLRQGTVSATVPLG